MKERYPPLAVENNLHVAIRCRNTGEGKRNHLHMRYLAPLFYWEEIAECVRSDRPTTFGINCIFSVMMRGEEVNWRGGII